MTRGEKTDLKILGTLFLLIFIAIIAFILTGCNPNYGKPKSLDDSNSLVLDSTSQYYNKNFTIFKLDGCEYVVVGYGNHQWGGHKGDCKNPIHGYKNMPIDTTEKHFDCTIQDIEPGNKELRYMCTTECGIVFYTNSRYKIGDTIKNFKSPKHK
jgi:hypothetical protein